jgi:hypothetical protein
MSLRHASFFSGVGGLDQGFERAGNGVVAPVAEFIGRRLVGVDAKWFKKEVEG